MLKISQVGSLNRCTIFKLEGRLVGPWVEELRRICEPILAEDRMLDFDLSEVSFADAEGVATLNNLKSLGVKLSRCSPFVEQQINTSS